MRQFKAEEIRLKNPGIDLRSGITGLASLKYRNEEELLAQVDDPVKYNDEVIWLDKVRLNCYYYRHYSFIKDIEMIFATVLGKKIQYAGGRDMTCSTITMTITKTEGLWIMVYGLWELGNTEFREIASFSLFMDNLELQRILSDIQSSPKECEWIEMKHNNWNPELIGEYVSALSNGAAYMGQSRGYLAFGLENETHRIVGTDIDPRTMKIGNQELENWIATQLSPRIDFSFSELDTPEGRVVIAVIDSAGNTPVKFRGTSYIRVGSYKKPLSEHPERERKIWQNTHHSCFETKIAKSGVDEDDVLRHIDYPSAFRLLGIPLPDNRTAIIDKLCEENIVVKRPSCYDITNLGAILFANSLEEFVSLKRKAVRLIFYKGDDRINAIREIDGSKGYAIGFEGLIQYISDNLPTNEQIGKVFRQDIPMYPSLAIREFVANALIHQDFSLGGSAPMIEVFRNRMEITNPGKPLIDTMRFIDHAPLSRNELLASTMRRMGFCEERGSGVDRALAQCEIHQLPAPIFLKEELFTKVTMFAPMTLRQMNAEDKVRACYQHCCLQYVAGKKMTNETFRDRLGIAAKNYSIASRIIADAIDAKLVKPQSEGQSKKYAQYIPIWA